MTISSNGSENSPGIVLLIAWYWTQGKQQVEFVKNTYGKAYEKKSLGMPLLTGLGAWTAYLVIIFALAMGSAKLTPKEVADQSKSLILEEWGKKPELVNPSIQDLTLVEAGGDKYTGNLKATISGQPMRFSLDVTYDGKMIRITRCDYQP